MAKRKKRFTKDGFLHDRVVPLRILDSTYTERYTLLKYLQLNDPKKRLCLFDKHTSPQLKHLLTTSIVCSAEKSLVIRNQDRISYTKGFSLNCIVDRVISLGCLGLRQNDKYVLSQGYQRIPGGRLPGQSELRCLFPNSIVSYVKSRLWIDLHDRIGDDLMIYMLSYLSVFVKTKSSCYFQVCGKSIDAILPTKVHRKKPRQMKKQKTRKLDCNSTSAISTTNEEDGLVVSVDENNHGSREPVHASSISSGQCIENTEQVVKCSNLGNSANDSGNMRQSTSTVALLSNQKDESKITGIDESLNTDGQISNRKGSETSHILTATDDDTISVEPRSKKRKVDYYPAGSKRSTYKRKYEDAFGLDNMRIKSKKTRRMGRKQRKRGKKEKSKGTTFKPKSMLLKRNFFYSTSAGKSFPKKHIMETTPANSRGARELVRKIFIGNNISARSSHSQKSKNSKRLPKKLIPYEKLVLQFLVRHKSCPFRYLLDHHCPDNVPTKQPKDKSKKKTPSKRQKRFLKRAGRTANVQLKDVTYSKVLNFCRSVCKRVIPPKLWGSKRNMEAFLANLWQFISLRKREKFSLQQLMEGFKVNDCEFLKKKKGNGLRLPPSEFLSRQKLIYEFFLWFMDSYITPLLKNEFTITESAANRNRVYFYRKSDWRNMSKAAMEKLTERLYSHISEEDAQELIKSEKSLGYSLLRLIPKKSGERPVVNLSLPNKNSSSGYARSINQELKDAFHVLDYERETTPACLGAANFGVDDVFTKLKPFVARHKAMQEIRPLYFVRLDVSNCYDSIKQEKMLEIIEDVLSEDEYIIRRYCFVTLAKGNTIKKKYKRVAVPTDDCRTFPEFINDSIENSNIRNAVLLDQVKYKAVQKEEVLEKLRNHITCNIIKMSRSYYRQKCGIPQGSVVSPMLCSYYLGHLERKEFSYLLEDPDSLLLRWVDDFLLMTYSLEYAKQFLFSMLGGFPEYNCTVKSQKSLVNFEAVTPSGEQIQRLPEATTLFPWCCFLINTRTLEVQADYSRYEGKDAMKDSLTVDLINHPGSSIFSKLQNAVSPKCHQIYIDLGLNTKNTVLINMYQAFLYVGQRFHAHVTELPKGQQVKHNPNFFVKGLMQVATYYYNKVVRITGDSISRDEIFCLFIGAVLSVLSRKPARYTGLLEKFSKQRKQYSMDVQKKVSEIASVAAVPEFLKFR